MVAELTRLRLKYKLFFNEQSFIYLSKFEKARMERIVQVLREVPGHCLSAGKLYRKVGGSRVGWKFTCRMIVLMAGLQRLEKWGKVVARRPLLLVKEVPGQPSQFSKSPVWRYKNTRLVSLNKQ